MSEPTKPTPSLYAKLAEVMAEIGHVPKRGQNTFHRYSYVMEADLVDAVRAKLATRNVVLIPSVTRIEERATQGSKPSTITTVHVDFTFCDGDSGQVHTASWAGSGDDPADKGLYKAYTGAVKYFLMKAFLIPTGDDPEADTKTDERSAALAAAPAAKRDTISSAEAKQLYDSAQAVGVSDERLVQAVAHYSGAKANVMSELTGAEALKLGEWLERKGAMGT